MNPIRAILNGAVRQFATFSGWIGAYASTSTDRDAFKEWKPKTATAAQTLVGTLTLLVAQGRHLERTTPAGRSISDGASADIVGSGIDILPNTGDEELDAQVIEAFHDWAENAMADESSLWAWQSMVPREIVAAGNVLARWIVLPERAAKGLIPLCILPLEAEWLSEMPVAPFPFDHKFIRGVEIDKLGRTVAFHLRHPESLAFLEGERVLAEQIIHNFERRRAQQVIGEPILAPVIERILQDDRLVRSELQGSVNASAPAVAITSEFHPNQQDDDGDPVTDIEAGATVRLLPGEEVQTIARTRPDEKLAPFRSSIRGDIAGATRTSQYWLDRDAGRANFSSMRMDQLLTKRALASLKEVIGTGAAGKVYQRVFPWIMLSIGRKMPSTAIERRKMMRYDLRPDQPEYVEPVKDTQAAINKIANNLSTLENECSARNMNWRTNIRQRAIENALLRKNDLPVPVPEKSAAAEKDQAQPAPAAADDIEAEENDAAGEAVA